MRDIHAEIFLYRTEDGGRKSPILNGFRSPIILPNNKYYDAQYELINIDTLYPGQRAEVYLTFFVPNLVRSIIAIGMSFKIWEGGIKGEGKILDINDIDKHILEIEKLKR